MKILIAPDSFKGSLSAREICSLFLSEIKGLEIDGVPLADGGEGSLEAIALQKHFKRVDLKVNNPLFDTVNAYYLLDDGTQTAYVELALASGLALLDKPDVMNASSYGTGELIADAIEKGARQIVLFAGGSATNDAGTGIAAALGVRFFDIMGDAVRPLAKNLTRILKIDRSHALPVLNKVKIIVAVDVDNPFYGKTGAAHIYARQKGANSSQVLFLDEGLRHLANIFYAKYGFDVQKITGSGAAGGIAGGLAAIFNAEVVPASKLIFELTGLEEKISKADLIISGEGKIDYQTLNGKLLAKVSALVQKYEKKLWAICGYFAGDENLQKQLAIEKIYALAKTEKEIATAINNSEKMMIQLIDEILIDFLKL